MRVTILIATLLAVAVAPSAEVAVRIKDIAAIEGVRDNQLLGYGLVVGLDDSGDKTDFTKQSMVSFLSRMGLRVDANDVDAKNVAAVVVTTDLPPFGRMGSRIDVTVSCLGDAESLQGGILLLTPLHGADGEIYAVAQGPVTIGGFNFASGGQQAQRNHPTVGRIPGGAIIEREVSSHFVSEDHLRLLLHSPDFTTASNVAASINEANGGSPTAQALDSGTVDVNMALLSVGKRSRVSTIAAIEKIRVVSDTPAKVVINERTGTVVAGEHVRISTVAVSHAGINVEISTTPLVSQPEPFSEGKTVVTEETDMSVSEESRPMQVLEEGATISDMVRSLNAFGVTRPRDVIAIFQALKAAGALRAELVVM